MSFFFLAHPVYLQYFGGCMPATTLACSLCVVSRHDKPWYLEKYYYPQILTAPFICVK